MLGCQARKKLLPETNSIERGAACEFTVFAFTGLSYVYLDMSDSSKGPKFDRTFRQDRFPRQFSNAQHSAMPGRGNHQPCIPSTSAGDYCRPNGSRSMKLYGDASVFQVRVDGSAFNVCHCFVLSVPRVMETLNAEPYQGVSDS